MMNLNMSPNYARLIATLIFSFLLAACGGGGSGGGGSSAAPGTTGVPTTYALTLTPTAGSSEMSNAALSTDMVGNWIGALSVEATLAGTLGASGIPIQTALINTGVGSPTIITLNIIGYSFFGQGTLSPVEYKALIAAGNNLKIQYTYPGNLKSTSLIRS